MKPAILLSLLSVICCNAEDVLKGPSLGFVYDEASASARPILGIVGSASFGPAIAVTQKHALLTPDYQYVMGVTADESAVSIRNLSSVDERVLPGSRAGAKSIVLSPKGTAAAVFYAGRVQLFAGLPADPVVTADFEVAGAASIGAVSDDGKAALIAQAEGNSTALYTFDVDGNSRRLSTAAQITGLAYFSGSHNAVFSTNSELYKLGETGELNLISALEKPAGLAISSDSKRVLVVSSELKSISMFDMDTGTSITAGCSCSPRALYPLASADVFRMTNGLDEPTWIVDASGTNLRVAFVPKAGDHNE